MAGTAADLGGAALGKTAGLADSASEATADAAKATVDTAKDLAKGLT